MTVRELISVIKDETGPIRMNKAKELMLLSEEEPEKLYDYFDSFVEFLSCENNIIKWNALITLANLTLIDKENKFDAILEIYFSHMYDNGMVTPTNIIKHAWKIIKSKPNIRDTIIDMILKIDSLDQSVDCKNIMKGKL